MKETYKYVYSVFPGVWILFCCNVSKTCPCVKISYRWIRFGSQWANTKSIIVVTVYKVQHRHSELHTLLWLHLLLGKFPCTCSACSAAAYTNLGFEVFAMLSSLLDYFADSCQVTALGNWSTFQCCTWAEHVMLWYAGGDGGRWDHWSGGSAGMCSSIWCAAIAACFLISDFNGSGSCLDVQTLMLSKQSMEEQYIFCDNQDVWKFRLNHNSWFICLVWMWWSQIGSSCCNIRQQQVASSCPMWL